MKLRQKRKGLEPGPGLNIDIPGEKNIAAGVGSIVFELLSKV